ncbi:hypothetical protein SAMN04488543_2856 [Friedmanniella luteola]|uniref:Uncharacterized protein n=1 Tax=Friedmanniella luteola TaxID=546871 RepID=A0A1H1X059_9ACTN|nr:hypothetical protein [Friedmanniella luteola]SDT01889.1 hypothetical protein SAMN04488543_2856 [Friedmanniella luteola]
MQHLFVTLHLLGLRLQDHLDAPLARARAEGERGSITIEQVAWSVGIIAIVAIAVAAIRAYVVAQVGKL